MVEELEVEVDMEDEELGARSTGGLGSAYRSYRLRASNIRPRSGVPNASFASALACPFAPQRQRSSGATGRVGEDAPCALLASWRASARRSIGVVEASWNVGPRTGGVSDEWLACSCSGCDPEA